ncbi:MAG: SDR family oxidoreductase [Planctomycetes bacterium]|nr:SDR family oxidoreductase [Planctomycetota bacterium]
MSLAGKVALVTGGAVRIGRAICEALAAEGARVVIHFRTSEDAARALASALAVADAPHLRIRADLSVPGDCEALIGRTIDLAGRLDILVNNASVFDPKPILRTSAADLEEAFRINLFAPFVLIREFAARVERGRIVNLLDRRITSFAPGTEAYSLAKKALADLTRMAALALAPRIAVNGVAPGVVLPPAGGATLPTDRIANVPIGRRIAPEEVARAVVHLLENEALNGQIIFADGGEHLKG